MSDVNEAVDLRTFGQQAQSTAIRSSDYSSRQVSTGAKHHKPYYCNLFKAQKLKSRHLLYGRSKKAHRNKRQSDSGNFGSSSITSSLGTPSAGSSNSNAQSSNSNSAASSFATPSPSTSSSGALSANVNEETAEDCQQPMSMVMNNTVPLIVMMQGQIGQHSTGGVHYSPTLLFKCNMCDTFSNNLSDVLNHVSGQHRSIHYCFACNRFHSDAASFERHKPVCEMTKQAYHRITEEHHYLNKSTVQNEVPLNLSVEGNVAMRAAQILQHKKGSLSKMKKLLKCPYCKKAFFGQFYLQRHIRSHTGEKLCYCNVCGKGFAEWRNLRNHLSRFHCNSDSSTTDSNCQKSGSPDVSTSDDDPCVSKRHYRHFTKVRKMAVQQQAVQQQVVQQPTDVQPCRKDVGDEAVLDAVHPQVASNQLCLRTEKPFRNMLEQAGPSGLDRCLSGESRTYEIRCPSLTNELEDSERTHGCLDNDVDDEEEEDEEHASNVHLGNKSSRLEITDDVPALQDSLNAICSPGGNKFFQCRTCSKTFRTKFAMQRHLDFHTDKRPFQCDQCSYKAKTKPQLKVHLMRHTGNKGYHCDLCSYSCVTHSDLNRHCKSRSHMFRVALIESRQAGAPISTVTSHVPLNNQIVQSTSLGKL